MNKRYFTDVLFVCVLVLASLICYAAGGFASGLAGGLAFAATAVLYALCKISGVQGLDSFHG